jgi:hypothetical protein
VFRSLNKATDFLPISPDLTKGGVKGDVTFGTLTTLEESPLKFGLLYTGSDDGLVYVSKDAGYNWEKISGNLPQNLWVSQVYPSKFDEGTVYVSLNGYRYDNFNAYVYRSKDYGKTWTKLGNNLPLEPVNVIKEDLENKNILYVGTDNGLYVSLNQGQSFERFGKSLPAVAVHDLVIHPREKDIIVATHGRSLYKASLKELQLITESMLMKPVSLFDLETVNYSTSWGRKLYNGEFYQPTFKIPYFTNKKGTAVITISTMSGTILSTLIDNAEKGLNYATYNFAFDQKKAVDLQKELKSTEINAAESGESYLPAGKYKVTLQIGTDTATQTLNLVVNTRGQRSFEPAPKSAPEEEESEGHQETK